MIPTNNTNNLTQGAESTLGSCIPWHAWVHGSNVDGSSDSLVSTHPTLIFKAWIIPRSFGSVWVQFIVIFWLVLSLPWPDFLVHSVSFFFGPNDSGERPYDQNEDGYKVFNLKQDFYTNTSNLTNKKKYYTRAFKVTPNSLVRVVYELKFCSFCVHIYWYMRFLPSDKGW